MYNLIVKNKAFLLKKEFLRKMESTRKSNSNTEGGFNIRDFIILGSPSVEAANLGTNNVSSSYDTCSNNFFTRDKVLHMLALYKEYKPKVATGHIKTIKKMWDLIAIDLSNHYKVTVFPDKLMNKFKVLERKYKDVRPLP